MVMCRATQYVHRGALGTAIGLQHRCALPLMGTGGSPHPLQPGMTFTPWRLEAGISPPHKWISVTIAGSPGVPEGRSKDLDALTQLCLCEPQLGTEVLLLSQGGKVVSLFKHS